MKINLHRFVLASVAAVSCVQCVQAQTGVVPNAPPYMFVQGAFTQQDLDAMLAPIALYPDSLLAQILMAATYPLEVADAARWSASIPGVAPQEAVRSVAQRGWDPSVQSLMAFPQVLQMMGNYPEWTQRLGNAFLSQQPQVWATVQALRQRAYAAGYLRSNEQLRVLQNGTLLVLEPASPEVIYVPYYDPLVVYGRWWWPGYAPMRWNPWPGYSARPGWGGGLYVGSGINVGLNFFFGQVNWNTVHATVQSHPEWNNRRSQPGQDWRHEPEHRHDAPYTSPPARPQPVPRPVSPEKRPEFRGQTPSPKVQVEPVPAAPRKPADNSEPRGPGRSRTDQGNAAPAVTTPTPSRPAAQPTPRPETGRMPGNEGRGQNVAPSGHTQPATPRAPAETKAPAREPDRRNEHLPVERNLSGK
jgi:hypothetical protein